MSIEEFAIRKPNQPTKSDPVPSQRSIVSEAAIFAETCPHCGSKGNRPCRDGKGNLLQPDLGSTEFKFHSQRMLEAIRTQLTEKMAGKLTAAERMLIVYYAFTMLADAVAANSERLFNKQMTSHEVEAFFAQNAITELKRDGLLK